jgi:hypothetical protein
MTHRSDIILSLANYYMAPRSVVLPSEVDTVARDEVDFHQAGSGGEQTPVEDEQPVEQSRTPLPVRQIFVLCLMRFAEPISFSVVSVTEVCTKHNASNIVTCVQRYSLL